MPIAVRPPNPALAPTQNGLDVQLIITNPVDGGQCNMLIQVNGWLFNHDEAKLLATRLTNAIVAVEREKQKVAKQVLREPPDAQL